MSQNSGKKLWNSQLTPYRGKLIMILNNEPPFLWNWQKKNLLEKNCLLKPIKTYNQHFQF